MEGIPNTFERVDKILRDMGAILERSTDASAEKLKRFTERTPDENELFATLELFTDQDYNLTYNQFYVKEDGEKKILDTKYATNEDAMESFLPEMSTYAQSAFGDTDYSDTEQENYGSRFEKMLYDWFPKCWEKAGGDSAKVPTYFAMDKEYMCHDMKTGEVLEELEVAKRLGYDLTLV